MEIKIIPKNKKGDIPTTLLVIGVIALCMLALFIFITSLNKTKGSFEDIGEIEKANMEVEERSLDQYNEQINDSEFNFWKLKKEEKIVFSIDYSS